MAREQSDVLVKIKRAVLAGRIEFSRKAVLEMDADGLTSYDIVESILNAVAIHKKIRSHHPAHPRTTEYP